MFLLNCIRHFSDKLPVHLFLLSLSQILRMPIPFHIHLGILQPAVFKTPIALANIRSVSVVFFKYHQKLFTPPLIQLSQLINPLPLYVLGTYNIFTSLRWCKNIKASFTVITFRVFRSKFFTYSVQVILHSTYLNTATLQVFIVIILLRTCSLDLSTDFVLGCYVFLNWTPWYYLVQQSPSTTILLHLSQTVRLKSHSLEFIQSRRLLYIVNSQRVSFLCGRSSSNLCRRMLL